MPEQTTPCIDIRTQQSRRSLHVNRLYAVLSAVNRAITRKPGRRELLQEICRILVEIGEFRMVRFGAPDPQGWLVQEATFGDTLGYFSTIRSSTSDIPEGRGPTGTAIREGRPVINNNITTDPAMLPWREHATCNGFNSSACFPVQLPSGATAGLTLYSTECDFFTTDEEQLLVEIASDIGYALEFSATQDALLLQQRELEALSEELAQRVLQEVQKCREKDRAVLHLEKMASIGQLAAGAAHEINNPIAFINGNLNTLARYYDQIVQYDRLLQADAMGELSPSTRERMERSRVSLDLEHLLTDGVDLLNETMDGVNRVARIVQDLKSFCRGDVLVKEPMSLNSCLERTLFIAGNELKYVATVSKEYALLPMILCHPGQLNQVFLNLLVNACHAVNPPGEIVLRSWHDDLFVYASVSDNGQGIPEGIKGRIFEPFFTTKEEGKGTGLGLSISRDIVKSHDGDILVESQVGAGATFTVKLPRTQEDT